MMMSFERADLRDGSAVRNAAELIRDLGGSVVAPVWQGGMQSTVGIHAGGVTVLLEEVSWRGPRRRRSGWHRVVCGRDEHGSTTPLLFPLRGSRSSFD